MNRNDADRPEASPLFEVLERRLLLNGTLEGQAIQLFQASPALFVENQGQWEDESVRYAFEGAGATVLHTDSGLVLHLHQREEDGLADDASSLPDLHLTEEPPAYVSTTVSVTFDGARQVSPAGLEPSEAQYNYFVGEQSRWRSGVPTFGTVVYEGLYEGIDLYTWGRRDSLKYEFHVAPGTDYRLIRIRYEGIEAMGVAEDGSLRVQTASGELVDEAPLIYQQIDGERVEVPGRFVLVDADTYGFEITGRHDASCELVIDPDLAWATYLGGAGNDGGKGIAVDPEGNAYVTGYARSLNCATTGAYNTTHSGEYDVFVAKLDSSGSSLLYYTYLGGDDNEYGYGIAVDPDGNAYVTGRTRSAGWATDGAYDPTHNGGYDVFAAKLNRTGSSLLYSTYLGGDGNEYGYGIAVDPDGNAYVTGHTRSSGWATAGAYDTTHDGEYDVFVAKLGSTGSSLLYCTYLGGDGYEYGYGIAADAAGNAYVTGYTRSAGWATAGAYDTTHNGDTDVFVAKLNPIGSSLLYCTYLGGEGGDDGYDIGVDAEGNAYVTGHTRSVGWATDGAYNTTHNGGYDVFVAKVGSTGSSLLYCTYLGGDGYEFGYGIAVDAAGNAYVTGGTESSGWATDWAYDPTYNGEWDVFVAKLNSTGSRLQYCTYLGGGGGDDGYDIAVDPASNAYVTGRTDSSGWATTGFDPIYDGNNDAFVARMWFNEPPTDISLTGTAVSENAADATVVGTLSGTDPNGDALAFSLLDDAGGRFEISGTDLVVADGTLLDYESATSHDVTVQVSDGKLTYSETLTIGVTDENEAPADISLSGHSVVENVPNTTVVGTLGGTDPDGDSLAFSLLDDADGRFGISGTDLVVAGGALLDYESATSHNVTVQASDGEFTCSETFTINVINVNEFAPTDISLSGQSVAENAADGTVVGTLGGTDPDGDSLTFSLLDGAAGRFEISGTDLVVADGALIDYESATSHEVTVQAGDGGFTYSETFTISVIDKNEPPTDISFTGTAVPENTADGTVVGTLSGTDLNGDLLTFSLLDDAGGRFAIDGADLVVADGTLLDYESASGHDVTVEVSDGEFTCNETFTIGVTDENDAPTGISLNGNSVVENAATITVVGTLSGTDPDGDSLTFSLLNNAGGRFGLVEAALVVADGTLLDYEAASSHDVTVEVSDGEFIYSETFAIGVTDENDAPTDMSLSANSVVENAANITMVGMVSGTDPDGDMLTFGLLNDAGGRFGLVGATLVVTDGTLLDYEAASSHDVTLQTDDGEFAYSETFTISVINVNEFAPTDISLSSHPVPEDAADGTVVGTLGGTDPDGDSLTFSLLDDAGGRFDISGTDLVVANGALLDYESATSHDVTVQAGDGEFTYSETFTIEVAPPLGGPVSRLWIGTSDSRWGNPANWSPAFLPGAENAVAFEEFTLHQATLHQDRDVTGVDFRTAGWMVGGRAFTLTVAEGGVHSVGAGVNTVNTGVMLTGDSTWTVAAGNTLNLPGALDAGGRTLTKDGEGVLFLDCLQNHALGSTLTVNRGTVVLNTDAGGTLGDYHLAINVNGALVEFGAAQHLAGLYLNGGMSRVAAGGSNVVVTETLVLDAASVLDLADNNLVLDYGDGPSPFDGIAASVASGCNGRVWDGFGITSSTAAAHPRGLTAVGIIDNSDPEPGIGGLATFGGVAVDETSVLVGYTWYGDLNMDGVLDSNDYDLIDRTWVLWTQEGRVPKGGFRWAVGDLNYDNTIDSNDYDLMDRAWLLSEREPLGGAGGPVAAAGSAAPDRVPPETALMASQRLDSRGTRDAPGPALSELLSLEISELALRDGFGSGLKAEEGALALAAPAPVAAQPVEPPADLALAPDGGVPDLLALSALDVRL